MSGDVYPDDEPYTQLIDNIRESIKKNQIHQQHWPPGESFGEGHGKTTQKISVEEFAREFAGEHNDGLSGGMQKTNAQYLGDFTISPATIANILNNPTSSSLQDPTTVWKKWEGEVDGYWYKTGKEVERSSWKEPKPQANGHYLKKTSDGKYKEYEQPYVSQRVS